MTAKTFPLDKQRVESIIKQHPTPFHLYDEAAIRTNSRRLLKAFSWMPGFTNYFAVKALPNPFILKILKQEGMGVDCSSLPELLLAEKAGFRGEEIMFTSNDTPAEEFIKTRALGGIINLDDISHVDYLVEHAGMPDVIAFRYNPGPLKGGNAIIGKPEEAKYGLTRPQMLEAYELARSKGATRFGMHTMVASNELNPDYFVETARILFELAAEVHEKTGIAMEFINLGGGIGIPYRPEQEAVDLEHVGTGIKQAFDEHLGSRGLGGTRVVLECGRMVTGPYGWLVSTVRHLKHTYKHYVGLDACMANLMRPALYGAYHHHTVLGKEDAPRDHVYDVTGSLCENNDKFAIDRDLPAIERGDIVVIHDTGAHGHAMGFNYNGKLRSAELLLRPGGDVVPIRRAETHEDYFATLDLDTLGSFS